MNLSIDSHVIKLNFPPRTTPNPLLLKYRRAKLLCSRFYKSPSHFHSENIKKIKKIKSIILSHKISQFKRLYERKITNSHKTLIDFELFQGFNAFCSYLRLNNSLQSLNLSSMIIDPLLFIRLAKALETHPTLKNLDLSNNSITSLGYKYLFKSLKQNTKLETVNLFNNTIDTESFRGLDELLRKTKTLKEVNFNFAGMDSEGLKLFFDSLAHNSSIKAIKIANKSLNYSSLTGLSYYLCKSPKPRLEELNLSNCSLSGRELQLMMKNMFSWSFFRKERKGLKPKIHQLLLRNNRLNGKNSTEVLNSFIARIEDLYALDLSKNQLMAFDLLLLASSFKKVQESLNLSFNRFQENFPDNIDFLLHLRVLDLSANRLKGGSIQIIGKSFERNPLWTHLSLSNNEITDYDAQFLFRSLLKNRSLLFLDLSFNQLTDLSLKDIPELLPNLTLRELSLSGNDLGVKALALLFPSQSKISCFKKVFLDEISFHKESFEKDSSDEILQISLKELEEISMSNSIYLTDFLLKNLDSADSLEKLDLTGAILGENALIFGKYLTSNLKLRVLKLRNTGLGILKEAEPFWIGLSKSIFIEELDFSKNKLSKNMLGLINCLINIPSLKKLDLSANRLENHDMMTLSKVIVKNRLESLDLSDNLFSYLAFESLAEALKDNKTLKVLKLGKMQLDMLCLIPLGRILKESSILEVLDLSETILNSSSILQLNCKETGRLTKISFNYLKIESFQYYILIHMLLVNPEILQIDLSECLFVQLNLRKLIKCLTGLKKLTFLNLSNISFTDLEVSELLLQLQNHLAIEILILKNIDFREKASKALKKLLYRNKSLQILDLSENRLSKIFFEELKMGIIVNQRLNTLKLNDCHIDDEIFPLLLDSLIVNKSLRNIELGKNLLSYKSLSSLFEREVRQEVQLFEKIAFENNPFSLLETFPLKPLIFNSVMELDLRQALKRIPTQLTKELLRFLAVNKSLISLNLNDNGFDDEILALLSESLCKDSNLLFLSLSANRFSAISLKGFFNSLSNNKNLIYLDFSNNIKSSDDAKGFCTLLEYCLLRNNSLEIVDISKNMLIGYINPLLKAILTMKKSFIFLNERWNGVKSSLAVKVLSSMQFYYKTFFLKDSLNRDSRIESLLQNNIRFKRLDFSNCELDDDFCLYFSDNIHKLPFLEEFLLMENYNITLSGLKNIYVGLILHKKESHLQRLTFKKINMKSLLNNGIAASIAEWGKYGEERSRMKKILQKANLWLFSKLITINNKFQFSEEFSEFSNRLGNGWVLLFYVMNFIIMMVLSITLPIMSSLECGRGHLYYSHVVYGLYVSFTIGLELAFWLYYKRHLRDYSENEKKLKRDVFLSDVLFLVGSAAEKFNLYLDVCFITISRSCDEVGVSNASIIIVAIKMFIVIVMFFKALIKLFLAIRLNNKVAALNLITKLAQIQYFFLISDILSRYVPGNVKRFKSFLGFRLKRSFFISTSILQAALKLLLEDIPQGIIQCYYVIDFEGRVANDEEWVILLNITKNFISLFASFYTTVSLRPSYIEQADFDERLQAMRLIGKGENALFKNRRATNLAGSKFEIKNIDEDLNFLGNKFLDLGRIKVNQGKIILIICY